VNGADGRPHPPSSALAMTAPELRAVARSTAERDLLEALEALEAVAELTGAAAGREGSAMHDAIDLTRAARARLGDAARYAKGTHR
jgi:hypothetical protein